MRQYILGLISGLVFGAWGYQIYLGFRLKQIEEKMKRRAELLLDCVYETKKAREESAARKKLERGERE